MAIQSRTRKELRQEIGRNLGAMLKGTTTGSGSTTTLVDTKLLLGGDDDYYGKYVRFTSGYNNGTTVLVSDFTDSTSTATFSQTLANTVASSTTYEMWDEAYNPDFIDDFINDAIVQYSPRALVPDED